MYLLMEDSCYKLISGFTDFRAEVRSSYILPKSRFKTITNRSLVFGIASQHMHFRRVIHKLTYIISDLEQPKIKNKLKY